MVPGFGDPPDHVRWRTKENVDMAYLMEFAYNLNAKYFLGYEDDAKVRSQNFVEKIVKVRLIKVDHSRYICDENVFLNYSMQHIIGKTTLYMVNMLTYRR